VVAVLLSLSSEALGAIAAVIISIIYYRRYEKRKWKEDTLKRLAAHRYAIAEGASQEGKAEFFAVLNEVFVVFHDAPEVLDALGTMHKELGMPGRLSENMATLFKRMCENLGIDHQRFNDSFFENPFTPSGSTTALRHGE